MMSPAYNEHDHMPNGWWLVPLSVYATLVAILFAAGWIWVS